MKAIGFRNFRKYKDFPMMELGEATMIVGANNSGKSTIVKAMLLIDEIVRNTQHATVRSFGSGCKYIIDLNAVNNLSLGSFERNVHHNDLSDLQNCHIDFSWIGDSDTYYSVALIPDNSIESSKVSISTFEFYSEKNHVRMSFDIPNGNVCIICYPGCVLTNTNNLSLLSILFSHFSSKKNEHRDSVEVTLDQMVQFNARIEKPADDEFISLCDLVDKIDRNSINIINGILPQEVNEFYRDCLYIKPSKTDFSHNNRIEYIPSYGLLPKSIYSIYDSTDVYSSAIIKYCSLNVSRYNANIKKWLKKWLKFFCIGEDLRYKSITGDTYVVEVEDDNGWCNLCDKGLGAIRIVSMLMKICYIIEENQQDDEFDSDSKPLVHCPATIIIEEPEQNLHPSAQSKLADLFYEISKTYNVKFLIETHSEYMVRRTQVLELGQYLKSHDATKIVKPIEGSCFSIYYVPVNEDPYLMRCQTNGKFDRRFGPGFYDVASDSAMDVYNLLSECL